MPVAVGFAERSAALWKSRPRTRDTLPSSAGCVAVQSTTVTPKFSASVFRPSSKGVSKCAGSVCTSSSTITECASRCSLRQAPGRLENRLSKSCTVVVTTSGASQFCAASRRHSSASSPPSACSLFALERLRLNGGMVFQDRAGVVAKQITENLCGLIHNAGVGNGIDDAAQPMLGGVFQSKGQPGACLAAAGRNGQVKDARRQMGRCQAGIIDLPPHLVDVEGTA